MPPSAVLHVFGAMQSAAVWQGKAHLPYCVLQWWSPHIRSLWHGVASGPGVAIAPDPAGAGAVGAGAGAGAGAGG